MLPADRPEESTVSVPASVSISRLSDGSALSTPTFAARPETSASPLLPLTAIASSPLVPMTMTLSGWASPPPRLPGEVGRHAGHRSAGQVADGDRVGTAQRGQVDGFDAVGVHRDRGEIAKQPQALAVGRQADRFV